jgi:hypothetical protein
MTPQEKPESLKLKVFVLGIAGACALGFGLGMLVGRQLPAHHYGQLTGTVFLYDSGTGKSCNPLIDPKNPLDQDWASEQSQNKSAVHLPPCDR